jgi:hypothetical protein
LRFAFPAHRAAPWNWLRRRRLRRKPLRRRSLSGVSSIWGIVRRDWNHIGADIHGCNVAR